MSSISPVKLTRHDKEKGLVMLSFMSLIGLGLMILLLFRSLVF